MYQPALFTTNSQLATRNSQLATRNSQLATRNSHFTNPLFTSTLNFQIWVESNRIGYQKNIVHLAGEPEKFCFRKFKAPTQGQGRRKHLKREGSTTLRGHFLLRRKGNFLKIKRALLCLLQNHGGRAPSSPGSYVYAPTVLNWLGIFDFMKAFDCEMLKKGPC